ncbi:MAG: hypothetical protein ACRDN0_39440, partial [Trebonia sp.]
PAAFARLAGLAALATPPVLVAVGGGTSLTRTLTCEQARMRNGLPALLIDPDAAGDGPGRDLALTTVLSGRADLVGTTA